MHFNKRINYFRRGHAPSCAGPRAYTENASGLSRLRRSFKYSATGVSQYGTTVELFLHLPIPADGKPLQLILHGFAKAVECQPS